jgi:hypothetical protein
MSCRSVIFVNAQDAVNWCGSQVGSFIAIRLGCQEPVLMSSGFYLDGTGVGTSAYVDHTLSRLVVLVGRVQSIRRSGIVGRPFRLIACIPSRRPLICANGSSSYTGGVAD